MIKKVTKKIILSVVTIATTLSISVNVMAYNPTPTIAPTPTIYEAQQNTFEIKQVIINEIPSKLDTIIAYNDHENIMIPVRSIGEALGFKVVWNSKERSVSLDDGIVKSTIYIGHDLYYKASSQAIGMSRPISLGSSPRILNGRTYVPISFFNLLYGKETALTIKNDILHITRNNYIKKRVNQTIVNGTPINLAPFNTYFDGKNTLIPVETLAKTLKFKVENGVAKNSYKLDNGICKSTIYLGVDSYFKASSKTIGMSRPTALGSAPQRIENKIYVPLDLFNLLCDKNTIAIDGEKMVITITK